jgi:acyl-coenzyme A synthetase/AMP-(fatty) acid ligase
VGQPDADVGQSVATFVVLAPASWTTRRSARKFGATVRGLLAPYKTPHVVVESLPKSPVGKILRRALR